MYFGGMISESKEVLGNKASTITVAANVRTNNDTGVHKVVHSLKVVKGG